MIYNLKVENENNTGDMACSPVDYFDFGQKTKKIDIREDIGEIITKDDAIIIGGGGLIGYHRDWHRRIQSIIDIGCRVVLWGAGSNRHYDCTDDIPALRLSSRCMVGIRDRDSANYLPCVSCMSEHFDNLKINQKQGIGLIAHTESDLSAFGARQGIDTIDNSRALKDVLQFISDHTAIITNTYHGAYWSQLLVRPVVIAQPFSTRFDHLPVPVGRVDKLDMDAIREQMVIAEVDEGLLADCRERNIEFSGQVMEFLRIF